MIHQGHTRGSIIAAFAVLISSLLVASGDVFLAATGAFFVIGAGLAVFA